MKKNRSNARGAIGAFAWMVGLWLASGFFSCAAPNRPGLADHRPTCEDERSIVDLMFDFQKGMNAADPEKILLCYTPDAGIMFDLTGDRIGVLLTKEEYAPELARKVSRPSFQNCSYRFDFLAPTQFFLDGEDALMTLPLEVYGTRCHYREKAVFSFEFRREESGWKICKSTWEVLESTHPKFRAAR